MIALIQAGMSKIWIRPKGSLEFRASIASTAGRTSSAAAAKARAVTTPLTINRLIVARVDRRSGISRSRMRNPMNSPTMTAAVIGRGRWNVSSATAVASWCTFSVGFLTRVYSWVGCAAYSVSRLNPNRGLIGIVSPATSNTGYARKLIGPDAGPGSTTKSRPRLSSTRLAGWCPK